MTQKARNKVSAKAGSNPLLNPEPAGRPPLAAKHTDKETTPTTIGLKIENPEQLAYAKERLENALKDWTIWSKALVGQDATKAALKAAIKYCDPPPQKAGRKKKPRDKEAILFLGRTSAAVIQAECGFKKHQWKQIRAEQKRRQRARKAEVALAVTRLAAAGIDTEAPDWIDDFIRLMSGGPNPRQPNTEINPTTIIGADE